MGCFQTTFQLYFSTISRFSTLPFQFLCNCNGGRLANTTPSALDSCVAAIIIRTSVSCHGITVATTRAIRCAATSGLAYRHVAYLSAAFLSFLRCHHRRWSKTVTFSPCWKIFSTVFANSLYYLRAISEGSTVIGDANNRPCCAPGRPSFDLSVRQKYPD